MHTAGIIYDEQRTRNLERYQEAVKRAGFLSDKEKENWALLAYLLTTEQLMEAERLIIDKDLKRLGTKYQLEKIKSNTESRYA